MSPAPQASHRAVRAGRALAVASLFALIAACGGAPTPAGQEGGIALPENEDFGLSAGTECPEGQYALQDDEGNPACFSTSEAGETPPAWPAAIPDFAPGSYLSADVVNDGQSVRASWIVEGQGEATDVCEALTGELTAGGWTLGEVSGYEGSGLEYPLTSAEYEAILVCSPAGEGTVVMDFSADAVAP